MKPIGWILTIAAILAVFTIYAICLDGSRRNRRDEPIVKKFIEGGGLKMFELGKKVRDKTTGHEGIITGRAEYFENPIKYYYISGNAAEEWIEEERIEAVIEKT